MYNRNKQSKPKGYLILTLFILGCVLSHLIDGAYNNPDILEDDYHQKPHYGFYNDKHDIISPDDSYYCQNGTRIERSSYCDGIADCSEYAEDERDCETCAEGYYRCIGGICINETLVCDGEIDCHVYEDDEKDCEKVAHCAKTKAKCNCIINSDILENEIRCYGENMTFLPNKINPAITSFNLKLNKLGLLGGLTHYTFSHYQHITKLYLDDNEIEQLDSKIFENLTNLKILSLSNNRIWTLDRDIFKNLQKLEELDLSSNYITKLHAGTFSNQNYLLELRLHTNKIEIIEEYTFHNLTNLKHLDLNKNLLKIITPSMFQPLVKLISLNLNQNNINIIEDLSFKGLKMLNDLYLGLNDIKILRSDTFVGLKCLKQLELQQNKIEIIESGTFEDLIQLTTLNISFNNIKKLTHATFSGLNKLELLFLQNNEIATIETQPFYNLKKFIALNLSNNRITRLKALIFDGAYNLSKLYLQNNRIKVIDRFSFYGLRSLKILNLRHNEIEEVDVRIFEYTPVLEHLITDEYRFCCMKTNLITCIPPPDEFSSCHDLMANNVLRISIWIQGIIAIIANLFVIIFRSGNKNSNLNKVNSFLIKNLALSDLFMGFYLLLIAFIDSYYRGQYYLYDFKWRMSLMCNFAGFISTFSSELTVFTLTVITTDRLFSITFPFRIQQREINRTKLLMTIVWILAGILASIPLPFFRIDYFNNFYGRSGVCLPLHITNQKANGWQYSVFVFIILNSISFIIITLSYISMYWLAKQSVKAVNPTTRSTQTSMAFRMTLLVLTDAVCWIPIIILGIRSLIGYTVSPDVYAWIAVFILPLNAALNPILYTISTIPLAINFKNSLLNGQIKFRWPCYGQRSHNNGTSLKSEKKGSRL